MIYVTSGGLAYHYDRGCSALADGQRQVAARGGAPSPVTTIPDPVAGQNTVAQSSTGSGFESTPYEDAGQVLAVLG